jgi:CRISPR-associated protein Cas2
MSRYIAAYDVVEDDRRRRIAKILDRYGRRLQKSVFEVWLDPDELVDLRRELGAVLGFEDLCELIPIDLGPERARWHWGPPGEQYEPVNVVDWSDPIP